MSSELSQLKNLHYFLKLPGDYLGYKNLGVISENFVQEKENNFSAKPKKEKLNAHMLLSFPIEQPQQEMQQRAKQNEVD